MTVLKYFQCDWCMKKVSYGKTMVYKMETTETAVTYEYDKSKSFCELRFTEYPDHITKHICKDCIDQISPSQKSYPAKSKSGI